MAARGRGRVCGSAEERGSGRPDSELLLHPELLSEEFLLLTLEQVWPGKPARPWGDGPRGGAGGEVRGLPCSAGKEGVPGLRPCCFGVGPLCLRPPVLVSPLIFYPSV